MQSVTAGSIDFQTVPYVGDDTDDAGPLHPPAGGRGRAAPVLRRRCPPSPQRRAAPTTAGAGRPWRPPTCRSTVYNGSGTSGLAGERRDRAARRPATPSAATGNADASDYTATEIRYAAGDEALAATLAAADPRRDDQAGRRRRPAAPSQLVLGSDFNGVGQAVTARQPTAPTTEGEDAAHRGRHQLHQLTGTALPTRPRVETPLGANGPPDDHVRGPFCVGGQVGRSARVSRRPGASGSLPSGRGCSGRRPTPSPDARGARGSPAGRSAHPPGGPGRRSAPWSSRRGRPGALRGARWSRGAQRVKTPSPTKTAQTAPSSSRTRSPRTMSSGAPAAARCRRRRRSAGHRSRTARWRRSPTGMPSCGVGLLEGPEAVGG